MSSRRIGWLFFALALIQLIPIWSVAHVPTTDGPSHVYNAWLIHELVIGGGGNLETFFAIDWRPIPNWLGHAVLALLMFVVPPAIAEKILVSAIVLLFLGASWFYAGAVDERARPFAFLSLPFAFHLLLQMGFYNFCISAALFILILGIWWKRRDRPDARTIALIATLLLLCWFSHPMSTVLAIAAIAWLWLATLPGRALQTHARHLLAIIPVVPLIIWFASTGGSAPLDPHPPLRERLAFLWQQHVLLTFDERQVRLGIVLSVLLLVLIIATIAIERRRREADALLILTLIFIALFMFIGDSFGVGGLLRERVALLIPILPIAWLTPRLPRAAMAALVIAMSIVAVGNAAFHLRWYRHYDRAVTHFLETAAPLGRDAAMMPLLVEREVAGSYIGVLSHAIGYVAIEKRLADISNYEARSGVFPIRPGRMLAGVNMLPIEATPEDVDVRDYARVADYVFTWAMPRRAPVQRRIDERYDLVAANGKAAVYRRLPPGVTRAARWETILLPVAGTARGMQWSVEQRIRNTGTRPVRLLPNACGDGAPCEFIVGAGETLPFVSSATYVLIDVERADADQLSFSTTVERRNFERIERVAEVPAVRESQFRPRLVLRNVDVSPEKRLNLRVWSQRTMTQTRFVVRVRSIDHIFATDARGYYTNGELASELPELRSFRGRVDVEISSASPLWAFVTATENATGAVTLSFPAQM